MKRSGRWRYWIAGVLASALFPCFVIAQQLQYTPYHANGIYHQGETVGWTVTAPAGTSIPTGTFSYTITANFVEPLKTGKFSLSTGPAKIEVAVDHPEMIYVKIFADEAQQPDVPPAGSTAKDSPKPLQALGAAVDPRKLQPSVPRPADFDDFWKTQLARLETIPINPVLTPVPTEVKGIELYELRLDSLDSHVYGYLAKPSGKGKSPALVLYQYAGVYKLNPKFVTDHAAEGWIVLDVDSHDIPPDNDTGAPKDYSRIGNDDRDRSYFLKMFLRDTRAIDYMTSMPEWDGKTLVVTGGSMGGEQSLVTAALNPGRVTAALVSEPAGADTNADLHGRKAGYPYWPSKNPQIMKTALYFDPVNFAPRIRATTVVSMGFIDTTAPPAGIWTVFNQITAPKEAFPMIDSDHDNRTPEKVQPYRQHLEEILTTIRSGKGYQPPSY